jgi:hypothetical protein
VDRPPRGAVGAVAEAAAGEDRAGALVTVEGGLKKRSGRGAVDGGQRRGWGMGGLVAGGWGGVLGRPGAVRRCGVLGAAGGVVAL